MTRVFIKVVQYGGFTKAADALGLPKSTISKTLRKLEILTGTRLLIRNTRSHTLTAAGRLFYESCLGPLQQLEEAQKSLYGSDSLISGKIKITSPEDLGSSIVAPALAQLKHRFPNLSFELHFTNRILDLIKEGFDLAIRIGTLKESQMKVRPIGHLHMALVAAPLYLQNRPAIQNPSDILKLDCLSLSSSPFQNEWRITNQKQKSVLKISSRFESNHMTSLLNASVAGGGILLCPMYLAKGFIARGELVHLLPNWYARDLPLSILSPLGISSTGRLRVVVDELTKTLKEAIS